MATNSATFHPDDRLIAFASVWNFGPDIDLDLYIALMLPGGVMLYLPSFDAEVSPYYALRPLLTGTECEKVPLVEATVPRTYWMALALTRRGYLDLACEPAFAEFRVTRVQPRTWRDSGPNYATFEYIDHRWYLTKVNLEINHTWSTYINGESSSGSDIKYFVRQEHRELDDDGYGEITWHEGPANGNGLYVNLHVYQDHASVHAYGYDRQTLPPNGARIENWSLSTTLRP